MYSFFRFLICATLHFYLMNTIGHEMKNGKKLPMWISLYMDCSNFETFHWNISLSSNLLFMKCLFGFFLSFLWISKPCNCINYSRYIDYAISIQPCCKVLCKKMLGVIWVQNGTTIGFTKVESWSLDIFFQFRLLSSVIISIYLIAMVLSSTYIMYEST